MKNLIILCTDEMRGDCLAANARNDDIHTPHLDALARRGSNFTRHFANFPKCVPARVSLMTGRYCHTDGYRTIHQHLPADSPDLASTLKAQGYELALFGKNHCWEHALEASHTPPELKPGQRGLAFDHHSWTAPFRTIYDRHRQTAQAAVRSTAHTDERTRRFYDYGGLDPAAHFSDEAYTEQAIEFLRNVRDRSRPFFLQVNIEAPHPVYAAPNPWFSMYDRKSIKRFPRDLPRNAPMPLVRQREVRTGMEADESLLDEIQAVYYGMVSRVDDQMGRIINAIEQEGLFEDSVVLFWSDHGDFASQYGLPEKWDTTFSDCLTHVPMILAGAGVSGGVRVESLSDHSDIAPTLCELLGIDPLPGMHGRSLLPATAGQAVREAVFADGGHEDEMLARFTGSPNMGGKQETYRQYPDTMARAKMVRTLGHKLVVRLRGGDELYDLQADPWEMDNRIDDPALASVRSDLQRRLLDWCLATDTDRPYQQRVGA